MGINSLEEVYKNFLDFNVISISPIEAGHINDTYLVKTKENMFILQRIQKAIDILKLEYNYELYSKAFDEVGFLYPKWIRSKTGELFYTDTNGYSWRMYPFVEGDILSTPLSDRNLYSLGQGLAKMHLRVARKESPAVEVAQHGVLDVHNPAVIGGREVAFEKLVGLGWRAHVYFSWVKWLTGMFSMNSSPGMAVHGKLSHFHPALGVRMRPVLSFKVRVLPLQATT